MTRKIWRVLSIKVWIMVFIIVLNLYAFTNSINLSRFGSFSLPSCIRNWLNQYSCMRGFRFILLLKYTNVSGVDSARLEGRGLNRKSWFGDVLVSLIYISGVYCIEHVFLTGKILSTLLRRYLDRCFVWFQQIFSRAKTTLCSTYLCK